MRLTVLLALLTGAAAFAAAPAPVVIDINRVAGAPASSNPRNAVTLGARTLFVATDRAHGIELWKTDGTDAGTTLLADVRPGAPGSSAVLSAVAGAQAFFTADDGLHGVELWATDGTAAGTRLLADANPNAPAGVTAGVALTPFNGSQYFLATSASAGQELWRTDGTPANTVRVTDVNPGAGSGAFGPLVAMGGALYFVGDDGVSGTELWKTDGTAAGTVRVSDVSTTGASVATSTTLVSGGAYLVFAATNGVDGVEAYVTDGTPAGTRLLVDANTTAASGAVGRAIALGTKVLFLAQTATGASLFVTDGTSAGTVALAPAVLGSELAVLGARVFFQGTDATNGVELWSTDGTVAGTALLKDVNPTAAASTPRNFVVSGGKLWFVATDAAGASLWATDGTAANTGVLAAASSPSQLFAAGNGLWFSGSDATNGVEPWHSDGTAAGTVRVADVNPAAAASTPVFLTAAGNAVLFAANDGVHGIELWSSDGTAAATRLVLDVEPANVTGSSGPTPPVVVGAFAYFVANDGVNGVQVWRTDGTPAGTTSPTLGLVSGVNVPNLSSGSPTAAPNPLTLLDGELYFLATSAAGLQLWKTDGTAAGTSSPTASLGLTVAPGAILGVMRHRVYFAGADATNGVELWRTDGTAVRTELVKDIRLGTSSSSPRSGAVVDNTLAFIANSGIATALCKSDGSSAGTTCGGGAGPSNASFPPIVSAHRAFFLSRINTSTSPFELFIWDGAAWGNPALPVNALERITPVPFRDSLVVNGRVATGVGALGFEPYLVDRPGFTLLEDIDPGTASSDPDNFLVVDEQVWFSARGPSVGAELFVADGYGGASLVVDLRPGTASSSPTPFAALGSRLLFTATGADNTSRLWITDGRAANTVPIAALDVVRDPRDAIDRVQLEVGRRVYFAANGGTGTELWVTDGTPGNTRLVSDMIPGTGSSTPRSLVTLGGRLLFSATDPLVGRELFALDIDATPPVITPTLTGTLGDNGFYTSNVSLSWSVEEAETDITAQSDCLPTLITTDSPGLQLSCSATSLGGTDQQIVTIKRDTQPPLIICPAPFRVEATGATGASVDLALPPAFDAIDPAPVVTLDHMSGETFALGTATLTATAKDAAGHVARCMFTATVVDTTAPELICPGAMSIEATSAAGATVSFALTATDAVTAQPGIVAEPASGSVFAPGTTLVQATATDSAANVSRCAFQVTVRSTGAPNLTCPADQTATATGSSATVEYPAPTATDVTDPAPRVVATHASGDSFPVGKSTVQVTATNQLGRSASCSFTVTVAADPKGPESKPCGCGAEAGLPAMALALLLLVRRRRS